MNDEQMSISQFSDLSVLHESHNVFLVQSRTTGKLYVKKVMQVYNPAVYKALSDHPVKNTPRIYAMQEDQESHTLTVIEEYISGSTLQELLDQNGPFRRSDVIRYGIMLCTILADLHRMQPAIIHRDLKPSNVILTEDDRLVLIDLNAARQMQANKDRDTRLLGTQGFAAPEQFGFGESTPQTDLYAMGVLMTTLLTGDLDAKALPKDRLSKVIGKCLNMNPKDRYRSASGLRSSLLMLQKKHLLLLLAAAVIAILFLIAGITMARHLHSAKEGSTPVVSDISHNSETVSARPQKQVDEFFTKQDQDVKQQEDAVVKKEKVTADKQDPAPAKDTEEPEKENDSNASPVGVYRGNDSDILVISENGSACYYCYDPTFTELDCPWTYQDGKFSIEFSKMHCEVYDAVHENDFSELMLRSDSPNWNAELFVRIDVKPEEYLTRTVLAHDPAITVEQDGSMHFTLDGISFYVPKHYCDFEDDFDDMEDCLAFASLDVQTDYVSSLLFYETFEFRSGSLFKNDGDDLAESFCDRFVDNGQATYSSKATVAGNPALIYDLSGTLNGGFMGLSGYSAAGKLAIILNKKSGKIIYVQFLQATDRQLDYMDDFDRILSEAE